MHFFIDLPYVAQKKLFSFMDFEKRLLLRHCSKRTQELIDSLPMYIDRMTISVDIFSIRFSEISNGKKLYRQLSNSAASRRWETDKRSRVHPQEAIIREAMDKLCVVLKNKNLKINILHVPVMQCSGPREQAVIKEASILMDIWKSFFASLNRQIYVRQFYIDYTHEEEVLCFLKCFRPGYLKTIRCLIDPSSAIKTISEVMETEQWKQAKYRTNAEMDSSRGRLVMAEYYRIEKMENNLDLILSFGDIIECE